MYFPWFFILLPLLKSSQKFTFDGQMVIFFIIENIQIHHCICSLLILPFYIGFELSGIFFFENMWFCHLFSNYDIFKRSLNSLNYYYLIFLSRISTRFIVYAFCQIFIYTCEIKRIFVKKIFCIVLPPLVLNIDLAKMWQFPTFTNSQFV